MSIGAYYEQYWSDSGFHPERRINPGLVKLFTTHIPTACKLIDVGCGNASLCGWWFQQRGCDYLGVDVSAHAVAEAKAAGLKVCRVEDAALLPYPDDTFDAAVCIEVFEHLFEPHKAAREILRILKPGGVLVATVPNAAYWRRRVELLLGCWNPFGDDLSIEQPWRDPHIRFFTRSRLRAMLVSVGFVEIEVGGHSDEYPAVAANARNLSRKLRLSARSGMHRLLEGRLPALLAIRLHAVMSKGKPLVALGGAPTRKALEANST